MAENDLRQGLARADPAFDTTIGAFNLVGFSSLTQWYAYSRITNITNAGLNRYWEKAPRLTRLVLERHTPGDALMLRVARTLESNLNSVRTRRAGHP